MPEGPSIVLLREEARVFTRRTVRAVSGNSRIDLQRVHGRRVVAVRSWGKHLLIQFSNFSLRIHLMLFGSYRINEDRPVAPRLRLEFDNGFINFYACSVRFIDGNLDAAYDWRVDVMSDHWDPARARRALRAHPDTLACDALLDQAMFAGVGNIIKNEVLHRCLVHPCNRVGDLPAKAVAALVRDARAYSFQFLEWKKAHVLKKHWRVHTKRTCPRCGGSLTKAHLGRLRRRAFFCERCQVRFGEQVASANRDAR